MNKYQKYLMESVDIRYILKDKEVDCWINEEIKIQQDEDITKTIYELKIHSRENIENIYFVKGTKQKPFTQSLSPMRKGGQYPIFSCVVDFYDRIESVKIVFKHNLADDLMIPVCFFEADKEKYYAKKEQERKDTLFKAANIKTATGADLINIYFQPCCDEYDRTEILLYKDEMLIGKYKVEEEFFFKSITGLAYGDYEFVLKQMNSNGEIIIETNKIKFYISAPEYVPCTVI